MMKKLVLLLLPVFCFSITYAGYENGGVITTYVGDVDCFGGLLEVKNGGAADLLEMQNSSHLKVWSTSDLGYMGGIWDIRLLDHSHLDYYSGWTDELTLYNYATADLRGGRIDGISSFQYVGQIGRDWVDPHINIYALPGWSWTLDDNQKKVGITGQWWDSTPFDIHFTTNGESFGYDPVWENINVIPEPATLLLFVTGGLFVRRKRK